MKTFFMAAKLNEQLILKHEHIKQLPSRIGLVTNIQHVHKLEDVKEQLESAGKKVSIIKGFHSKYPGQMYGCDFPADFDPEIEAVLFIGTGKFHPRGIFESKKDIYIYDPVNRQFCKASPEEAEAEERKRKAGILKFLHSTEIGVIISTKPGQMHNRVAEGLRKAYPEKNYYLLVCDTVDFNELGNFTFIECFVNTACPRMLEDYDKFPKPMVNIEDAMSMLTPEQKTAKKHPYPLYTKIA